MKHIHLLIFLLLHPIALFGQERGMPLNQDFPQLGSNSSSVQYWAVVQDKRGVIYAGMAGSFIWEFDGLNWNEIPISAGGLGRGLAVDAEGVVYVGCYNDIGYLAPDSVGKMQFNSLKNKLPKEERDFKDIWRAWAAPHGVFFFSRGKIFRWHQGKMRVYNVNDVSLLSSYKGEIYHNEKNRGLTHFNRDTFELVPGAANFTDQKIYQIFGQPDSEEICVISRQTGIGVYDKNFNPLPKPSFYALAEKLKTDNVSHATSLYDGRFAVSTLRGGVYVFDKKGGITNNFLADKNDILDNNVWNVFQDNQNGLWVSHNKGLERLEIGAISVFNQKRGLQGAAVNDFSRFQGEMYAATSSGLYRLDTILGSFFAIPEIKDQTWSLETVWADTEFGKTEYLLAGTDKKMYLIGRNRKITELPYTTQGAFYDILMSGVFPGRIYAATENALRSFQINNQGVLHENATFEGVDWESRGIMEDYKGNIWLRDRAGNLFMIETQTQLGGQTKIKRFSKQDSTLQNTAFHFLNTPDGFYTLNGSEISRYDYDKGKFLIDEELKRALGSYTFSNATSKSSIPSEISIVYATSVEGKPKRNAFFKFYKNSVGRYSFKKMEDMDRLAALAPPKFIYNETDKNKIWVASNDALYLFDSSFPLNQPKGHKTLIRKVIVGEDLVIFNGAFFTTIESGGEIRRLLSDKQTDEMVPELAFEDNSITFQYSSNSFDDGAKNYFSHYLVNYEKHWTEWVQDSKKEYTNLPEGEYTFLVKSKNLYGQESPEAVFKFIIRPPFYRTYAAYAAYIFAAMLSVWGVTVYYSKKLLRQKKYLAGIIAERTAELVEQRDKLREKNEEVSAQNDEIRIQKTKVEKAYENVQLLSDIGKEVTSSLDLDEIIDKLYQRISPLMDTTVFGIGILNENSDALYFPGTIEKQEKCKPHSIEVADKSHLSVWCLNHMKNVRINDLAQEYKDFVPDVALPSGFDLPKSILMVPLLIKEKAIGVVTVQSYEPNVYSSYQANILVNLAMYASIALENAESFLEIETQKGEIQKKNEHITASINYARRIQEAMLPDEAKIKAAFDDSFIFFKPRDIVSGDFYWFAQKDGKSLIAAVDCTGHGVPGAFMSMVGNDLLNEIVHLRGITDPGEVLSEMNRGVMRALRQEESGSRDSMDMVLCSVDKKGRAVLFAGAGNILVYFNQNQMTRIKGDSQPVGGQHTGYNHKFTTHEVKIENEAPTYFYIYSDGYKDQFGGPNNRKFLARSFHDLLQANHLKPFEEQKEDLKLALNNWIGEKHKQTDDIMVIGFKVS